MKPRPYHLLGSRIRLARTSRGITQRDFAKQLGTDQSQMWKWEAGIRQPCTERLVEISRRLKVSLDYLLKGTRENSNLPER